VTPSAHLVVVGAPSPTAEEAASALEATLAAAGFPVGARTVADVDEAAIAAAVRAGPPLALVLAFAASAGTVRRAVDRVIGDRGAAATRCEVAWGAGEPESGWAIDADGRIVVVLPRGARLDGLVHDHLLPFLRSRDPGRPTRVLRVIGPTPAEVEARVRGLAAPAVTVVVLPGDGETWVRLDGERGQAAAVSAAADALAQRLGEDCYGHDDETLERVVGRLLLRREWMVSVAESCTGGLVSHRLTAVPGSSAWFERGVIVYSNRAKQELLGVPEAVLRGHGAVSAPCAEAMARGMAAVGRTACALSITGIAGPDGGTPAKPVGTVFIGLAVGDDVTSRHFQFAGDRASIKWQSAHMALDMLRRRLVGAPRVA
jgi:nicotinamide-nucleotide amidase